MPLAGGVVSCESSSSPSGDALGVKACRSSKQTSAVAMSGAVGSGSVQTCSSLGARGVLGSLVK